MIEQSQRTQTSSSPSQIPSIPEAVSISKQEVMSVAVVTASTKYDVLPPRAQQTNVSTQPNSVSTPQSQTSLATPIPASGSRSMMPNSVELLASARAKLAATKRATTPAVSSLSQHTAIQEFEITHLKTIKCDVCQQKNTNFLFKCQNCTFNHQICSRCVEATDPHPAEGSTGRRDWSVHAKLKDAHAAYSQPICSGKKEDGSYEQDGVRLFLAKGKKGGVKQPRKRTPKRDVTPAECKTAARHTVNGHRTTEQGRRILARVISRLEMGQDEDLKKRVEAARAKRGKEPELTTDAQSEDRKRKADVLDGNDENEVNDDAEDDVDNNGEDTEQMLEDAEGDELEAAAAIQQSMLGVAPLGRHGQTNRSRVQRESRSRGATLSPLRSVPHSCEYSIVADLSPIEQMQPLPTQRNRPSTTDFPASHNTRIKARREPSGAHLPTYSSTSLTPSSAHRHKLEMKITSRKSASRKSAAHSLAFMLETQRRRDQETGSSSTESSSDSIDDQKFPREPQHKLQTTTPVHSPHQQELEVSQGRKKIQAQQELQYAADENGEDSDIYAQDRLGISMLLQAAKFIDEVRSSEMRIEQDRIMQLDGQCANTAPQPSELSRSDELDRLKEISEIGRLGNISRLGEMPPTNTSTSSWPSTAQQGRRSERLASTYRRPYLCTRPRPGRADVRRSKTGQPTPVENTNIRDENVRQRINALQDKAATASRGKLKRDWDPLVKSYIKEQQAKRRKTMQWVAEQESSDEEGYDNGVEGGFWVESESTGSGEGTEESGKGNPGDDGGEDEHEVEKVRIEIQDSEDADDDHDTIDESDDPDSDPILAPGARRRSVGGVTVDAYDDDARSAVLGHRKE